MPMIVSLIGAHHARLTSPPRPPQADSHVAESEEGVLGRVCLWPNCGSTDGGAPQVFTPSPSALQAALRVGQFPPG